MGGSTHQSVMRWMPLFHDGLASLTHCIFVYIKPLTSEIAMGISQIISSKRKRRRQEPSTRCVQLMGCSTHQTVMRWMPLFHGGLASLTHCIFVDIKPLLSKIAMGISQIISSKRKHCRLEPSTKVSPTNGWLNQPNRHEMDASVSWRISLFDSLYLC